MDNFFDYVSKPLSEEDVDILFRVNNIIPEKLELFSDFSLSLNQLINETYLGEENTPSNETKIVLTDEDNIKHFDWCWGKIADNFEKENLNFEKEGEHYDYFKSFFIDVFYNQKDIKIKGSISQFLGELFDTKKTFTKSDVDMILTIYKLLDKKMKKVF
jgi:hypothetical protein